MKVISLRHAAVFVKAGSYVIRPKSSSSTFIWRKSIAFTVPSVISTSYVSPVRLSVTESELLPSAVATAPPLSRACVCSSAIAALLGQCPLEFLRTRWGGCPERGVSEKLGRAGLAPVRGDPPAPRHAHARWRGGERIGVRAAARRRPVARRARVERLAVVRNARGLGVDRVGLLGSPPDDVEQHRDGDLEDHHHPDVEVPGHLLRMVPGVAGTLTSWATPACSVQAR